MAVEVAQEVLQQQLAEAASRLRRTQNVLESRDLTRLLEHLLCGAVELREPLDDLRGRLSARLLCREHAFVYALEPPVDALVDLNEPAVEAMLDAAQAIVDERASGSRERDDERGEESRGNNRDENGDDHEGRPT